MLPLGKNMCIIPKGGGLKFTAMCMPSARNLENGDFCQ
jgi:hypothetical protein